MYMHLHSTPHLKMYTRSYSTNFDGVRDLAKVRDGAAHRPSSTELTPQMQLSLEASYLFLQPWLTQDIPVQGFWGFLAACCGGDKTHRNTMILARGCPSEACICMET